MERRTFISGLAGTVALSGCIGSKIGSHVVIPELNDALFDYLNENQFTGNRIPPRYGVEGLQPEQIDAIESQLGFEIPSDFRYLLGNVQDPGDVLFPWSRFSMQRYTASIDYIWSGIEFDIEHNTVWLKRWGERPADLSDAKDVAEKDFRTWPKLLPVYGHRYLAAEPCLPGNPVFSIKQTDIIYYGVNLADYLLCEFGGQSSPDFERLERRVPIWSDFAELTDGL